MKILLPIDGSDCSKATLEWATGLFDPSKVQFELFYVVHKAAPEELIEEYQIEEALDILRENKAYLEDKGYTVAKTSYLEGDPVDLICQYAKESDIEQVLIGSHGRSGLAKVLLGSVSSGVLENCESPVFVYKNKDKAKVSV